jgi:hypothetical protein
MTTTNVVLQCLAQKVEETANRVLQCSVHEDYCLCGVEVDYQRGDAVLSIKRRLLIWCCWYLKTTTNVVLVLLSKGRRMIM